MLKSPDQALRIPLRIFQLVPEEKRRLGFIVFLITGVHLLLFFTVEVVYPTAKPLSQRRSEIFLSSPDLMGAESWQSTQFWNQMRDPSVVLHQNPLPTEKTRRINPVFENELNSNLPLLAIGSEAETPWEESLPLENRALEKMVSSNPVFIYTPGISKIDRSTKVVFSKNLEVRKKTIPGDWPEPSVNLLNETGITIVKIGVNSEGFVTHALVEESSGANGVDQMALKNARKMIFLPQTHPGIEWGVMTFFWSFANAVPAKESP